MAQEEDWRILVASAIGSSHLCRGEPCQDAHAVEIAEAVPVGSLGNGALGRPVYLVAISDGAGTAAFAEDAASLAATTAVADLKHRIQNAGAGWWEQADSLAGSAIMEARSALEALAQQRAQRLWEFACTMILVAASEDRVAGAHVGDGAVVVSLSANHERLRVLSGPQPTEYINQTSFVTDQDYESRIRRFRQDGEPLFGLAAFSDGLQFLSLRGRSCEPHIPFFAPVLHFLEGADDLERARDELQAFLAGPRVCAKTSDDKTLLIGVRKTDGAAAVSCEGRRP